MRNSTNKLSMLWFRQRLDIIYNEMKEHDTVFFFLLQFCFLLQFVFAKNAVLRHKT